MKKLLARLAHSGPAYLLRGRGFRLLWIGEVVSQIGDGLNKVALLWFVYQTHHSALKTSVVGVLQTLPALVLSPLIGVWLDRWSKKRTLIFISVAHGALVALIPLLYGFGVLTLGWLYALVLVTSVVATFYGPTLTLTVPLIVKAAELRAANALIQSTATIGVLLGPLVAGVTISAFGTANVLYIDAGTFLFFVACMGSSWACARNRARRSPAARARAALAGTARRAPVHAPQADRDPAAHAGHEPAELRGERLHLLAAHAGQGTLLVALALSRGLLVRLRRRDAARGAAHRVRS